LKGENKPMSSKNRILIVDDEPAIARTLAAVFKQQGYDARAAFTTEDAIRLIADWLPHLAIVDVLLKESSGVELAMLLRERSPQCKVALFTGILDLTDLLAQAEEAGQEFEIIPKPVHPTKILKMVAAWLSTEEPVWASE
jgi:DNA-binding NtrC family response regulator